MAVQKGAWTAVYCPNKRALLLGKRSKFVNNPFLWNFFGGTIDSGESPKRAAMRELREEAGIKLSKSDLIPMGRFDLGGPGNGGDERELYFFLVIAEQLFKPKLNYEHSEYRWFQQDNLPLSINRPTTEALNNGLVKKAISFAAKHKSKAILA